MSTQGTRSPIEMIWTAKNVPFLFRMFLVQRLGKDDLGGSRPILPGGGERHPARDPHPGAARLLSDGEVCDRGWTKELVAGRERPREGGRLGLDEISSACGRLCLVANWTQRVLSENCMFTTVDAGLGFWDIACDETYYPVCQRMRQLDKIEFFMDPVHITSVKTGLRFRWNTVFILLPGLETPPSCHGNWLSLGATHTKL